MKICYDSYCKAVFVIADFIFGYWYCVEVDCVAGILEEHLSFRRGQSVPLKYLQHTHFHMLPTLK